MKLYERLKFKLYKTYFKKESLVEMAVINNKRSGMKKGYFIIKSEKRHPLFPHVHFVFELDDSEKEYIKLNINKDIDKIIIKKQTLQVSKDEIEDIKKFISENAKELIDYYMQKKPIDTDLFLDSLKKVK